MRRWHDCRWRRNGDRVTVTLGDLWYLRGLQSGSRKPLPERQIISMPPREGPLPVCRDAGRNPGRLCRTMCRLDKAPLAEPLAVSWHTARWRSKRCILDGAQRLGDWAVALLVLAAAWR